MINFVEFCFLNKKFTYNNDHRGEILIDRGVCSSVVHLQVYRMKNNAVAAAVRNMMLVKQPVRG